VRATILSLFTFGSGANPDFTPDVDNAVGTPSLVQAGGSVDATGATTGAVAFTDADGNPHSGARYISWSSGVNDAPANTFSLNFNSTGFQNLIVRYDERSTATGSPSALLEYSVGGGGFTTIQTDTYTTDSTFHAVNIDLSAIASIQNASNVSLRWTFAAGSSSGTSGVDNLQLTGTAVPEPGATVLLFCLLPLRRFRR
jgi:hypothetical protein